ncbi:hypothetical protein I4U23_018197 [Adineta vaga]|nr:hypothetical protein I4U23_018197 [Adineta vaga]
MTQFIQDIHTKYEAIIESPTITQAHYSYPKYKTIPSPSVPKCLRQCYQLNWNSIVDKTFQLNLFDSSLFQWKLIHSNQQKNYFSRKRSTISFNTFQTPIQSLINYIQSQRQYVPLEYSSWNVSFPNYDPMKFSLKKFISLNGKLLSKNPHGRTGLQGQGFFENVGPNYYIISIILTKKNSILLIKNSFNRYELPKSRSLKKTFHYHTLDIVYLDHPLNTDDAWIEIQIILIRKSSRNRSINSWFSFKELSQRNDIEDFDFNLIKFYL